MTVPYNEARYGRNAAVRHDEADGYWNYIKDTATPGTTPRRRRARPTPQIKAYLAQFDKVDRYDYDGDGNFNEPDGYIDHFQAIHAGEGEEAGGGAQGADAIWSHRWYAYSTDAGQDRPGRQQARRRASSATSGIWIGDYTTEPENGGLGVFAHEFGHDLGLPDLYDTAGGDNSTGFWTLMSGGSWLNHGTDSIGTTPGYMGPWEKLQLGWLDHKSSRSARTHGQAEPGRPRHEERLGRRRSSSRCPSAPSPRSATPRTPARPSGGAASATTSTRPCPAPST